MQMWSPRLASPWYLMPKQEPVCLCKIASCLCALGQTWIQVALITAGIHPPSYTDTCNVAHLPLAGTTGQGARETARAIPSSFPRAMKHHTVAQGWVQAQGAELPPTPTISLTWAGWGCSSTSAAALQHLVPSPGSLPHCSRLMPVFCSYCAVLTGFQQRQERKVAPCPTF